MIETIAVAVIALLAFLYGVKRRDKKQDRGVKTAEKARKEARDASDRDLVDRISRRK